MSNNEAQALLQSPETMATVIHAIMRRKYGDEAYDWDLVTSYMQVQADFKVDMASAVANRWGAIQVVMTTDAFFTRPDAFMAICNTLTTGNPFFDVFNPVTLEEAAWGIAEVAMNREMLPFGYMVKKYIKLLLGPDGYTGGDMPDVIQQAFEDPDKIKQELHMLKNNPNNGVIDEYIEEQLQDMVSQFNRAGELAKVDDIILAGDSDKVIADL